MKIVERREKNHCQTIWTMQTADVSITEMVMVMLRKTLSISLLLSMSFAAAHAAPNAPYVIA
jgi:hypothetical protein